MHELNELLPSYGVSLRRLLGLWWISPKHWCGGCHRCYDERALLPIILIHNMRCGHGDVILERSLFMLLRSVEMIAFLRVLSILKIVVCMPFRCLSGNCGTLSQHKFVLADMASVVDIMDKAFYEVFVYGA